MFVYNQMEENLAGKRFFQLILQLKLKNIYIDI